MWIGDERRNAAWDALCTLKRAFDAAAPALPDEARRQAERALGRCKSSDWYWWMGFDEPVPAVLRFDAAFREALLAVYAAIGRPAPDDLPGTFSRLGHSLHGPVSMQDLAHAIAQAIGMEITVPVPEGELNWNSHQPVAPGSPLAEFLAAQGAEGWLFVVPAIELPGAHRPAAFKYAEIRIALEKANQRFFEGRARLVNGDVHPGLLVIGVDREQARRVVERFRVVGGVWGEEDGAGEVLVVGGGRAAGGKA